MARWKLMNAHYIHCLKTEWEYQETGPGGEPIRKRFLVPRLLDPRDPKCFTNRWGTKDDPEGEIIVCYSGKGEKSDIVIECEPTPDMMPVDDEAKEISAKFTEKWKYKPDIETQTFSQSMIDMFQEKQAELQSKPQQVEVAGLAELVAALTVSTQQTAEMVKSLTVRKI